MKNSFVVVMTTCRSRKEADSIARQLVAKRLVACANIWGGVTSYFRWKGRMDAAREAVLLLKTRRGNFKKIEKAIRRIHSYEVPEIIAIPIAAGARDYIHWLASCLDS